MSRGPNHVIMQDVLQGTCISMFFCFPFYSFNSKLSAHNQTTLDPTARSATWQLGIGYKYLTHREKANLDSQEVHDNTLSYPPFSTIHDHSGFIIFCMESINLYYFNIIKKYTSHMYDLTNETKINLNTQN